MWKTVLSWLLRLQACFCNMHSQHTKTKHIIMSKKKWTNNNKYRHVETSKLQMPPCRKVNMEKWHFCHLKLSSGVCDCKNVQKCFHLFYCAECAFYVALKRCTFFSLTIWWFIKNPLQMFVLTAIHLICCWFFLDFRHLNENSGFERVFRHRKKITRSHAIEFNARVKQRLTSLELSIFAEC